MPAGLGVQQESRRVSERLASGGRAPGWPGRGARSRTSRGQDRQGPSGAALPSAPRPAAALLLAGEPSRAELCSGVRWQLRCHSSPGAARPARPGHSRAAALAGRAEMLARPQSRLCLRREPLGAIPTTSQARPPSQTPPLLPAPPLPPGGRRRSETVRV